ncbi:MAG: serine/threonine-protein kinase [Dokdonella sp.]
MDPQRWRRARTLFDALVDEQPSHWETLLLRQCDDDAEVRAEALAMLRADSISDAHRLADHAPLIIANLAERISAEEQANSTLEHTDQIVGPFQLLREVGRGGMGSVWLAKRIDGAFEQNVAIKLIRSGWDASDVFKRFCAERQILASLQHPNIAHLVDGGVTAEGKPWLALEFVDGKDLRTWCDQQRLDINARLRFFLTVCEAVGHAHQRLVVHRDLKPSNILVGNDGVVKLLDFGIAKLLDASTEGTSATRVFTPEYAAPEQIRGEVVTTSVDIHALGLLLYELLSGRRPYHVANSTPAAYERAVLDQEPTRPSLIVTLTQDGHSGDLIAASRDISAARLHRELRGDLDAIVLKALRKEPAQRYASVADFASDIYRYLERRPVHARRGNWRYHADRFLRRHAQSAALGAFAMLALIGGLAVATWQAQVARTERDSARQALEFMRVLFDNADPTKQKGDQVSVRDLLDSGVRSVRIAMQGQDSARADLLLTMASAYLGLGQLEPAAPLIEEARKIAERSGDKVQHASALIQQCRMLDLDNRSDACPVLLERAEKQLDTRMPEQAKLVAYSLALRVYGLQVQNRYDDIVTAMRRGLGLLNDTSDHRYLRVELSSHLAFALNRLGRAAEAEAVLTPLVASLRGDDTAERVLLIDALGTLSMALSSQGRHDPAIQIQSEALDVAQSVYGKDNPSISEFTNSLARAYSAAERLPEAVVAMERTVALDRLRIKDAQGPNPELASSLCNLAALRIRQGRESDARQSLDEAIATAERAGFDIELGRSLYWSALAHLLAGNTAQARLDIARMQETLAPTHAKDDDLMLRGRSLAVAIAYVEKGSSAATDETCAEVANIDTLIVKNPKSLAGDIRFAKFLRFTCRQHTTHEAGDARLSEFPVSESALGGYHARIARMIQTSLTRQGTRMR